MVWAVVCIAGRESTEQPGCASIVQPALMQRRICRSKLIPGPSVTSRTRTSCGPQPKGQNCGSRACLHVQLRRSWKRETAAPLYNGVSSLPIKTLAPPIEALCMKYKIITIAHASEILVERCRHWTLKSSKYQVKTSPARIVQRSVVEADNAPRGRLTIITSWQQIQAGFRFLHSLRHIVACSPCSSARAVLC